MRACVIAEREGILAVPIVSTGFLRQFRATARGMGMPDIAIAEYPGVIPNDSDETFEEKVRTAVASAVLPAFARGSAVRAEQPLDGPAARVTSEMEVAVRGDLDEIQQEFLARGWSDGMPVIPPTRDRIERFLEHTDRAADESLGTLLPASRAATVWSVAVNGVMAGCRPEYMPLLLAAVECITDPHYAALHAGATPGWEPLVIVSGPVVERFGFETGTGLMRVGTQANTTVGRFMRLFTRNVAGLIPGQTDKGSIGYTFNVAMAEDPATPTELGWPTYGMDRGFGRNDSVVTVQSVVHVGQPAYTSGGTPEEHLEMLTYYFQAAMGPWAFTGVTKPHQWPVVLLSPSTAAVFARAGWTKDRLRAHLREHARVPARMVVQCAWDTGNLRLDLARQVEQGFAPADYALSSDPDRLVPAYPFAEQISIVVAGDPGRNQSKVYINNHNQGIPTSRRIALP
jgi:hypothetical protein